MLSVGKMDEQGFRVMSEGVLGPETSQGSCDESFCLESLIWCADSAFSFLVVYPAPGIKFLNVPTFFLPCCMISYLKYE